MKVERKDADRNFTRRVMADFTGALFELLQEKSLESISATELCKHCSYPRSTFYNYFEDIYSVMEGCWRGLSSEMELDRFREIPHERRTVTLFAMLYAYMEQHGQMFQRLLKHNPTDGAMCRSLNNYMQKSIEQMVRECPESDNYPVPLEVVAEHYGNTIWMLVEHCFLTQDRMDRESALKCLTYLLGTLEKENARR